MALDLSIDEREEIRAGIERNESSRAIALLIGRDNATVSREIKRNGGRGRYRAGVANQRALRSRLRPKTPKLISDPELCQQVRARLELKDSPMRISIELKALGMSISHETIYRAAYGPNHGLPDGVAKQCLHLKRRRRQQGRNLVNRTKYHPLGQFKLIGDRPPVAAERSEIGHFEGDLIVGSYNRSAIITVFDRTSRKLWLGHTPNKSADSTHQALTKLFDRIPKHLRRTLTWDQGTEMAQHEQIAKSCNIDIYFAHPKSPWERPTNESGNAHIRRYVGKNTNLNHYSPADLTHIENRINTIPRRIHNWATANQIYNQHVALTT